MVVEESPVSKALREEAARRYLKAQKAYIKNDEQKEIEHLGAATLLEAAADEIVELQQNQIKISHEIRAQEQTINHISGLYEKEVLRTDALFDYILTLCAENHGSATDIPCSRCTQKINQSNQ
jgi:hypothetical protein